MKKIILLIIIWASLYPTAKGQSWIKEYPDGIMRYLNCSSHSDVYGDFYGGRRYIWRCQNNIIDTVYDSGNMAKIITMANSGDSLFFSTYDGLYKMKVGEPAIFANISNSNVIQPSTVNQIVTKGTKRWLASNLGLIYFDGTTYSTNNNYNTNCLLLDVDNNNNAYVYQNNALWKVNNTQYTLIADTIPNIINLKVNPVTNELYFSQQCQLYKYTGTTILPIDVYSISVNNTSNGYGLNFISFSQTQDKILLLYKKITISDTLYSLVTNKQNYTEFKELYIPKIGLTNIIATMPIVENNSVLEYISVNNVYKSETSFFSNNLENQAIIDKGNFRALINSDGSLFYSKNTRANLFEFPKNSGKSTNFISNIWLAGINQTNDTCVAACRFGNLGQDFWPGPIAQSYSISYDNKYDNIWKIDRAQIENHITHYQSSGYVTPNVILSWPTHGDVTNGEAAYLAPFYDADSNGIYNPLDGDYPIIFGQQAAYFIYNESRNPHTESGGNQLGVEVHGLAYVMDSSNVDLKHTLFVKYNIFNRLNNDFHDFYIGKFDDFDLGYDKDDYIGCDTLRQTFYVYNGKNRDGSGSNPSHYGLAPPTQGLTFLNNDMTQFVYFNNSVGNAAANDPRTYNEYYSILQAHWKDNTPYTFGGNGYGGTIPVHFLFSGNPLAGASDWTEISEGNAPEDRRGVGSIGPIDFMHGTNYCMDIAYVYSRDFEDTLTSTALTNLQPMLSRVDTIRNYFNDNNLSCNMNNILFSVNTIPEFSSCQHVAAFVNNSQLNYSLSIDSVILANIQGINPMLVNTSWLIYQAGQTIAINDVPFHVQDNVPVVLSLNLMHNPNTHIMNSQTIQYFVEGLVGINEVSDLQISIAPNPATNKVRIKGIEKARSIEILDILGHRVQFIDLNGRQTMVEVDVSTLQKGIYFVKVIGNKSKQITKKIVVQ
ncbi:MAG: T9SS type A sorting domain-containing protein [Bacteroidota bacterium]